MTKLTNIYDQALIFSDLSRLVYGIAILNKALGENFPVKEKWFPKDIRETIEENKDQITKSKFANRFFDEEKGMINIDDSFERLEKLEKKGKDVGKCIYITEINATYIQNEVFYVIWVDEIYERIILVFRGTDNNIGAKTGFCHNWLSNMYFKKVREAVPIPFHNKVSIDKKGIAIHKGFHAYLNRKTKMKDDPFETRIRDQILSEVKKLIRIYPKYKIFTTGHSLGAALSTLTAYYLAINEEIPSPIGNFPFQSPRLGDYRFLKVCQYLEKEGRLQIARFVANNDLIAVIPSIGFHHVGFQITMDQRENKPIKYWHRTEGMGVSEFIHIVWNNSILANINFKIDHGDFVKRILIHQKELKKMDTLDVMYGELVIEMLV